jgi:murein DD-endopeptidase MepM/ murein hydrolase activator NlpD
MHTPLPHSIRARGRPPLTCVVVLVAALMVAFGAVWCPMRPAGAVGAPVDPVPVGVWPLRPTPEVVRAFEPPDSAWGAGHRGVDLAGALGQSVRAALAGRVTFASTLAGRGVVVVDHGTTRTTYEPVVASVRVGDVLARGQPIGTLSLAGSHCSPAACLHWGWRRGDTYLDPLLLVGGGPIVLLPLTSGAPAPPGFSATSIGSPMVTPPYAELVRRLLTRVGSRRTREPSPDAGRGPLPVWHRPLAMRPLLL